MGATSLVASWLVKDKPRSAAAPPADSAIGVGWPAGDGSPADSSGAVLWYAAGTPPQGDTGLSRVGESDTGTVEPVPAA
jgi:hypothetical protein